MKPRVAALAALALLTGVVLGCGASFNGAATVVTNGSCAGHMPCGTFCCTEAEDGATDWECGGSWPDCPANACCYTGEGLVPEGALGAARGPRVKRIVILTPIPSSP